MHALNRNLLALALGAAFASPAAFAQAGNSGQATGQGQSTAESVRSGERPASPTLPTQADPRASDAISERTEARESRGQDTATDTTSDTQGQGSTGTSSMTTQASSPPGQGNWWKDADTDGDGKLSSVEANANAGLSSRFSDIDKDRDGFVTTEEYREFYTNTMSQGAANAAPHSAVVTRDVWLQLDTDADSRISLAEAASNQQLNASFAAMDSNSDGFVTQAEYSAYTQANK